MAILETIRTPADLKALDQVRLTQLAAEVRAFLVEQTSKTGGHLSPNLGVVELTFALHRVFDSPTDAIVWDTGHQAYVHKLVTGRAAQFAQLRQAGDCPAIRRARSRSTTWSRTAMPRPR